MQILIWRNQYYSAFWETWVNLNMDWMLGKMKSYCYEKKTMIINGGKKIWLKKPHIWNALLKNKYIILMHICINRISGRMCRCSVGFLGVVI